MEPNAVQNRFVLWCKYWLPPLVWALLIFYLSSKSSFGDFVLPFNHFDKLIHAAEYGVLCLLVYRAFIKTPGGWWEKRPVMLSIIFCILYAVTDEIHQMFVPMRSADIMDILSDGLGAGLSHIGLWTVRSKR